MEGIKEKEGEVIALEGERRRGGGREGWENLKLRRLSEEWTSWSGRRMLSTTFSEDVAPLVVV